jgi:hypothetical protein
MRAASHGLGAAQPPLPLRERVGVRGRATPTGWRFEGATAFDEVVRPLIRLPAPSPARGEGNKP